MLDNVKNTSESYKLTNKSKNPKASYFSIVFAIISIWIVVVGMFGFLTLRKDNSYKGTTNSFQSFFKQDSTSQCYRKIKAKSIVDLPEPQKIEDTNCKELIKSLSDKYADYFVKEEFSDFKMEVNNQYAGVGLIIGQKTLEEVAVVVKVIKEESVNPDDIPASKADIRDSDKILEIDGQSTIGLDSTKVSEKIRGKQDTIVKFKIQRSQEIIEKSVTRKVISLKSATSTIVGDVGILNVSTFSENIYLETRKELESLMAKGATTIVLDLRNNPGGILDGAIDISSLFVKKGTVVLKEKYKNSEIVEKTTMDPIFDTSKGKVILVANGYSASASEITVASLKENIGAKFIGTKTYGKGVVQAIEEMPNGDKIKLTVAEWLSPTGQKINKVGVIPDIEYDFKGRLDTPENLAKLKELI